MKIILMLCLAIFISLTGAASNAQQVAARSKEKEEAGIKEKQQYQGKVEARLRELDNEIASLKVKIAKQGKDAEKQLNQQMPELHQKREAAAQQLEKLRKSSQASWQDMKEGIEAAMKDLQTAYNRAASHFK
jgi:peptidoglycan hydrolase CwlO-like protein